VIVEPAIVCANPTPNTRADDSKPGRRSPFSTRRAASTAANGVSKKGPLASGPDSASGPRQKCHECSIRGRLWERYAIQPRLRTSVRLAALRRCRADCWRNPGPEKIAKKWLPKC